MTDLTSIKSNSCGSTTILVTTPVTTGWINALLPVPIPTGGSVKVIVGGFITS